MTKLEKKCFVLMPFKPELKEVYTEVYIPVCEKNGLKCWRVDEISKPGSITKDIVEGILDADVIIADLTGRNANVFYELGIAHSTGNKAIMTAQTHEDVPFDIASYRVIFYAQSISGCKDLSKKLDSAIQELLIALDRTNNPFQEVLASRGGIRKQTKTPLVKAVNISRLGKNLRNFIVQKRIIYLEDLKQLNLEEVFNTPGLGKTSIEHLCAILLQHDLCDTQKIHDFILRHKLAPTSLQDWRYNKILR